MNECEYYLQSAHGCALRRVMTECGGSDEKCSFPELLGKAQRLNNGKARTEKILDTLTIKC